MDEKLVKQEIQKLVDKFERIKEEGKYKKYNEENTKKDFILPLFRSNISKNETAWCVTCSLPTENMYENT